MKSLKLLAIPLALAGLTMGFAGIASATEYVSNGGFESSMYTNSLALFGPNTPATDWSSDGQWLMFCSGSGIACDNSATYGYLAPPVAPSPQGGNYIAIDGTSGFDGILSQTIGGLKVGESLTLSFYMGTAQECCAGTDSTTTETVVATLGDQSYTTPTITTPGEGTSPWTLYTTTFTYDGVGDVLSFVNNGTGEPPYALIDGVSLTGTIAGTPEPSTWVSIIAGFIGLVFVARVRRKAAAVAA